MIKVGESAAKVGFVECFKGSLFKNKLKSSFGVSLFMCNSVRVQPEIRLAPSIQSLSPNKRGVKAMCEAVLLIASTF